MAQQPPAQPPKSPYGPPPGAGGQSPDAQGFFAALFDLDFKSFVTLKFAKFIYILLIVVLALGWLVYVVIGFIADPWLGFAALLLGWIPAFLWLVLARVSLEFYIAMIRTSQNTAATTAEVAQLRRELGRR